MRIGVSSYSFARAFEEGTMDILDAIDWVADSSASHLEISIAGLGSQLIDDPDLVERIRGRAEARNVPLVNYVVAADFLDPDLEAQVTRLTAHLDVAHRLGIPLFRHDVVAWDWRESDQAEFERTFEAIVPVCRRIAEYAATLGITTSVENHGMSMNNSERVRRLVGAVDLPNFKVTLDVGNFLCVDELPQSAVPQTLPFASVVHLKDFYIRDFRPGDGWLSTVANRSILGAIVGFGDLPMRSIIGTIKASGFDGPISIEFEGLEDSLTGVGVGLANAQRIWNEGE
ncbi:MAG: sugar phosphate isomerase/epimerase [Burkholderiaceae bacterium]|nr:sugar phosphate isomerase/epimerase [Microbacteriaceae bacterium]